MRGEFGFRGYVVTDWGALNYAVTYHKYYSSFMEAAAGAANAGVNLELPDNSPAYLHLTDAVQQGLVKMETIFNLVKPLFYTRMRLGEFDPPTSNPYASIDTSVIENGEHRQLAVLAAAQSFVLLKNQRNTLPFTSKIRRLAVSSTVQLVLKPLFLLLYLCVVLLLYLCVVLLCNILSNLLEHMLVAFQYSLNQSLYSSAVVRTVPSVHA